MPRYGFTLFCEMHGPNELVELAVRAEEAGFDFLVISDHFHPWLESHSHSPLAWSVLGAVAARTTRIELATMVTCPFVRYHPAIVAQAAATIGVMSNGRFTLGLGAGERLNEHIVGEGWPSVDVRHEMLDESVQIIRQLWQGEYTTVRGRHLTVEDARIFDLPSQPPDLFIAAGGPNAVDLAVANDAGLCATEPDAALVQRFLDAGGVGEQVWGQQPLAWDRDVEQARKLAHERFRFGVQGWKVQSELPNIVNFEAATASVTPDEVAASVTAGADVDAVVEKLREWTDAGFANVAVVQVADDVEGFFESWSTSIRPRLP